MSAAPPLPRPSMESAPFWEACQRGELRLQRCARCGEFWFPPALRCPRCWSSEWKWEKTSGRGTLFSFVVYQRSYHPAFREALPYVVGVVELAEGPRMPTRIIDVAPESVRCGMPVEVAFTPVSDEIQLPFFRPSADTMGGQR